MNGPQKMRADPSISHQPGESTAATDPIAKYPIGERLRIAGIPDAYLDLPPGKLRGSGWLQCYGAVRVNVGFGILQILTGLPGCGKTQLAALVLEDAMRAGRYGRFLMGEEVIEMLLAVRSASGETEASVEAWLDGDLLNPSILIIDGVDHDMVIDTSREDAQALFWLTGQRIQAKRDTILTIDTTPAQLGDLPEGFRWTPMGPIHVLRTVFGHGGDA